MLTSAHLSRYFVLLLVLTLAVCGLAACGDEAPTGPHNHRPVMNVVADYLVHAGDSLTIHFSASDPDGDPVQFVADNLPTFAVFTTEDNGSATLSLHPAPGDEGAYVITITATDGRGGEVAADIHVTVETEPTLHADLRIPLSQTFVQATKVDVDPGDVMCLEPGQRPFQGFKGIEGTAQEPVTITNCSGGQVLIGPERGLSCISCKHVRITGTGDPSIRYGIKITETAKGSGIKIYAYSTDFEIDHVEITNTHFAGIMAKTDRDASWVMEEISIHDNYIHDTGGEGLYIGDTDVPGSQLRNVHIWNNVVARTGWDLFQIANAEANVEIDHNVFVSGGILNQNYHRNGFQIGDNNIGEFHHNIVMDVKGNGFIVMGSGNIDIHHNYVGGVGALGFFVDDRKVTIPDAPIRIRDNYIRNVDEFFFSVYNEKNPVEITGNYLSGDTPLIDYASGAGPDNVTISGNIKGDLPKLVFADKSNGRWCLPSDSPYAGIGLLDCN